MFGAQIAVTDEQSLAAAQCPLRLLHSETDRTNWRVTWRPSELKQTATKSTSVDVFHNICY